MIRHPIVPPPVGARDTRARSSFRRPGAQPLWSVAACGRFYAVKNFAITRRAVTSLISTCSGRGPSRARLTFRERTHQTQ